MLFLTSRSYEIVLKSTTSVVDLHFNKLLMLLVFVFEASKFFPLSPREYNYFRRLTKSFEYENTLRKIQKNEKMKRNFEYASSRIIECDMYIRLKSMKHL